jgi:hypothetical protein
MGKLKLNLDEIKVESFETNSEITSIGTIKGQDYQTIGPNETCDQVCPTADQATCGSTCGPCTVWQSCLGTCVQSCGIATCPATCYQNYTCYNSCPGTCAEKNSVCICE